jgi:hypothetical protein
MGLHETKTLCTTKEMVTRLKRQSTEWEKIFSSYTSDKGLNHNIQRAHNNKLPKNQQPTE